MEVQVQHQILYMLISRMSVLYYVVITGNICMKSIHAELPVLLVLCDSDNYVTWCYNIKMIQYLAQPDGGDTPQ